MLGTRHATDLGRGEAVAVDAIPEGAVAVAALLTRLGDPLVLLVVVAGAYLLADHLGLATTRMALVLALTLGAFALTLALKHAFALPRPPGADVAGYGFPSGHAIGATVVYGGVTALLPDAGLRRRAGVVAAVLVVAVAASRVALGVHYPVDVVAGVAVGLAYLGVTLWVGPGWPPDRVTAGDADRAFTLALAVGVAGLGVATGRRTVVAVAAAGGGWVGWRLAADRVLAARASTGRLAVAALGLPVVVLAVDTVLDGGFSLPVAAGVTAALVGGLLALPGLSAVVEKNA